MGKYPNGLLRSAGTGQSSSDSDVPVSSPAHQSEGYSLSEQEENDRQDSRSGDDPRHLRYQPRPNLFDGQSNCAFRRIVWVGTMPPADIRENDFGRDSGARPDNFAQERPVSGKVIACRRGVDRCGGLPRFIVGCRYPRSRRTGLGDTGKVLDSKPADGLICGPKGGLGPLPVPLYRGLPGRNRSLPRLTDVDERRIQNRESQGDQRSKRAEDMMDCPYVKAPVPKPGVCVTAIPAQHAKDKANEDRKPKTGRIPDRENRDGSGQQGEQVDNQGRYPVWTSNSTTATTRLVAIFREPHRSLVTIGCWFLCLLLLSVVAGGCQKERKARPEPVVERFLRAVNDKDINVMLTCVDPRQERMFRASFRLVEKFTGGRLPVEDLLELLPGLYQLLRDNTGFDVGISRFQVYRAKLTGPDTLVPVWLTEVRRPGDVQQPTTIRVGFHVHEFEEGWRIVGIDNR